jgi:hypothetical protein
VGFTLLRRERLAFDIHLGSSEEVRDLLAMTPYYWHAREETRDEIGRLESLETGAEFDLSLFAPR